MWTVLYFRMIVWWIRVWMERSASTLQTTFSVCVKAALLARPVKSRWKPLAFWGLVLFTLSFTVFAWLVVSRFQFISIFTTLFFHTCILNIILLQIVYTEPKIRIIKLCGVRIFINVRFQPRVSERWSVQEQFQRDSSMSLSTGLFWSTVSNRTAQFYAQRFC